jgi:hypothetical protein
MRPVVTRDHGACGSAKFVVVLGGFPSLSLSRGMGFLQLESIMGRETRWARWVQ